jgi:hypothetical protein
MHDAKEFFLIVGASTRSGPSKVTGDTQSEAVTYSLVSIPEIHKPQYLT